MFAKIVEEKILKSMREGRFDNLNGRGKPLVWEDNPFEKEDMRLTHHILKENGFLPEWLEKLHEIENETIRLQEMIHENLSGQENPNLKEKISQLNRKIMDYNLVVPLPALQHPLMDFEKEQAKIIERDKKPLDLQDV